jgi:hypothetical protein
MSFRHATTLVGVAYFTGFFIAWISSGFPGLSLVQPKSLSRFVRSQ